MAAEDDRELVRGSLRAILRTPGTGSRLLAAKAQAARQLALMNGEPVVSGNRVTVAEHDAPYPHEDLWRLEDERRARIRRREARQIARGG
jgi:hypothetical protein